MAVAVRAMVGGQSQLLAHVAQARVFGPEVVAPWLNAVRFVDDEEVRLAAAA